MQSRYIIPALLCAACLPVTGCSQSGGDNHLSNTERAALAGPADPQATPGPAIPATGFLNVAHPNKQIAEPPVAILQKPPSAAGKTSGLPTKAGRPGNITSTPQMNMGSMPGMNMKGGSQ